MTHKFFHSFTKVFLALAITLAGVAPAQAADGALDPTFGNGGKVTTDFGNSADDGNAIVIQADGKIIVAGSSNHTSLNYSDFTLARYNSDGSLDITFDGDGKVMTDFGNSADIGQAVAIQSDGKIILVGYRLYGDNFEFALTRYNSDGSLDTTFDSDGKVTTDFSHNPFSEYATAVAIQPDGKIIVVGFTYFDSTNYDIALARYNTDGSLDTSFDHDGKVITDLNGFTDQGFAVVLQPDGKILVAGYSTNADIALLRFHNDGSPDTTFGVDGITMTFLGGSNNYLGMAMILQPDSKIIVAGNGWNGTDFDFALARYNSDGSLDSAFDTDGIAFTDFTGSHDFAFGATLQPDGRIVTAGHSLSDSSDSDFELARYNSDGSLDVTFGNDGKVTTDFGSNDYGASVALQPDGKIVMAGASYNDSTNFDFALARYDGDGSAMEVTIDVKPGRFPNRIELEKNVCKDDDNLYVAILTTPDFDAMTTDGTSLTLGDPNLSGTVSPTRSRAKDVDRDGDRDIALTFSLCEMVTQGALSTSSTELVLRGMTLEGTAITGRDSVMVVRDD